MNYGGGGYQPRDNGLGRPSEPPTGKRPRRTKEAHRDLHSHLYAINCILQAIDKHRAPFELTGVMRHHGAFEVRITNKACNYSIWAAFTDDALEQGGIESTADKHIRRALDNGRMMRGSKQGAKSWLKRMREALC